MCIRDRNWWQHLVTKSLWRVDSDSMQITDKSFNWTSSELCSSITTKSGNGTVFNNSGSVSSLPDAHLDCRYSDIAWSESWRHFDNKYSLRWLNPVTLLYLSAIRLQTSLLSLRSPWRRRHNCLMQRTYPWHYLVGFHHLGKIGSLTISKQSSKVANLGTSNTLLWPPWFTFFLLKSSIRPMFPPELEAQLLAFCRNHIFDCLMLWL